MGIYIFRRIVLVAFITMSLILNWSLFGPTDYHYTRYTDVRIISEKTETIHNSDCSNKNHPHYYINQTIVTWKGVDSKGNICKFITEFDSDGDSRGGTCGTSYSDIKDKHIATIHNCLKSGLTWVFFTVSLIFFICFYCNEDLNCDYWGEAREINEWRFKVWRHIAEFIGYDINIINKVIKSYKNINNDSIIKYKELFDKYHKELQKLSEIQVTSTEN